MVVPHTPLLGEPTPITDFTDVASNGPYIAFSDFAETRIHVWDGTRIYKVVEAGDILNGAAIQGITLTPQAMDGDKLLFWADSAWYLASDMITPPASVRDWREY
jgi:hypothetical protein